MPKIDAKSIYLQFKKGDRAYKEEVHCPMIIEVMNDEGTAAAFMRKAMISDTLFYKWLKKHKVFAACYAYGKIISRDNWDKEGEEGKNDEFFNFKLWRIQGAMRYGVGKNRVRMGVNPNSDPYKQYQELVQLANSEEFSASEIKQLMESINVGIRAFESFKLQQELDEMKKDVAQMRSRYEHDKLAVESPQEAN